MSGQEMILCPFCGAPHRETIPTGTVQVKCKYCGGTILVPAEFGGVVQRCPNHPEVLAVGLCNDCGGSYCDGCLSLFTVEHGVLHLCPNCYKERETERAYFALIIGGLLILAGFFFIALAPNPEGGLAVGVLFVFFGLPFTAWGIYRTYYVPMALTIKERNEAIRKEVEFRKSVGAQASASELYQRLARESMYYYGPMIGYEILERRINYYTMAGMSRSEAVRKLAEDYGY